MYTHSFTTANVYPIGYTPDFSRVRRAPNGLTYESTSGKAEKLLKILKKNLDRELVAKKKLEGEFLAEEGPDKFSHGLGMY
ncbi:hypothetical protein J6590_097583 [Homalodisca vitripennis]|nr:hypothetical protein J6590_097583 [Homalodisca vitripennis]